MEEKYRTFSRGPDSTRAGGRGNAADDAGAGADDAGAGEKIIEMAVPELFSLVSPIRRF